MNACPARPAERPAARTAAQAAPRHRRRSENLVLELHWNDWSQQRNRTWILPRARRQNGRRRFERVFRRLLQITDGCACCAGKILKSSAEGALFGVILMLTLGSLWALKALI